MTSLGIRFWAHAFIAIMAVLFAAWTGQELWQISSRALVLGLALLGAIEMIRREFRPLVQVIHDRVSRSDASTA